MKFGLTFLLILMSLSSQGADRFRTKCITYKTLNDTYIVKSEKEIADLRKDLEKLYIESQDALVEMGGNVEEYEMIKNAILSEMIVSPELSTSTEVYTGASALTSYGVTKALSNSIHNDMKKVSMLVNKLKAENSLLEGDAKKKPRALYAFMDSEFKSAKRKRKIAKFSSRTAIILGIGFGVVTLADFIAQDQGLKLEYYSMRGELEDYADLLKEISELEEMYELKVESLEGTKETAKRLEKELNELQFETGKTCE